MLYIYIFFNRCILLYYIIIFEVFLLLFGLKAQNPKTTKPIALYCRAQITQMYQTEYPNPKLKPSSPI